MRTPRPVSIRRASILGSAVTPQGRDLGVRQTGRGKDQDEGVSPREQFGRPTGFGEARDDAADHGCQLVQARRTRHVQRSPDDLRTARLG